MPDPYHKSRVIIRARYDNNFNYKVVCQLVRLGLHTEFSEYMTKHGFNIVQMSFIWPLGSRHGLIKSIANKDFNNMTIAKIITIWNKGYTPEKRELMISLAILENQ